MDAFNALLRESMIVCALLAFPILIASTAIGTVVAIAQAATQIQEQTLTLLPKIIVVGLMVVIFGHGAFAMCAALITSAVASFPSLLSVQ
jgi:flagellar biosynthetic protein FliQ